MQVYELITCVRRANENAGNLISGVQFLINIYIYIYIYVCICVCVCVVCVCVYILIYLYLCVYLCGTFGVAFSALPLSQHQHCTDEAQKAETVLWDTYGIASGFWQLWDISWL